MSKKQKAFLSWEKGDYEQAGEEVPSCVLCGKTEGENMEEEDVEVWTNEQIRALSVIREDYPKRYEQLYSQYILDLEYLLSLGKISEEEKEKLCDKENFNFGQK